MRISMSRAGQGRAAGWPLQLPVRIGWPHPYRYVWEAQGAGESSILQQLDAHVRMNAYL